MKDPVTYPSRFEVWHLTPPSHWRGPALMVRCRAAEMTGSGDCGTHLVCLYEVVDGGS